MATTAVGNPFLIGFASLSDPIRRHHGPRRRWWIHHGPGLSRPPPYPARFLNWPVASGRPYDRRAPRTALTAPAASRAGGGRRDGRGASRWRAGDGRSSARG